MGAVARGRFIVLLSVQAWDFLIQRGKAGFLGLDDDEAVVRPLPLIHALVVRFRPERRSMPGPDRGVVAVCPDRVFHATDDRVRAAAGVEHLWRLAGKGGGATVGLVDTGVYLHPDLVVPTARVRAFVDLVNGRHDPYDDSGHGTHLAGVIAGSGAGDPSVAGVAPEAELAVVKVLDRLGRARESMVIAGIEWLVARREELELKVLNLSIGSTPLGPPGTDPVCLAAEAAWKAGITVVASAGNASGGCSRAWTRSDADPETGAEPGRNTWLLAESETRGITSPGTSERIITVGALDTRSAVDPGDDAPAPFSPRGPVPGGRVGPDFLAPGTDVLSLLAPGSQVFEAAPDLPSQAGYVAMSGTSVAAAVTSGICAVLAAANPAATPGRLKRALRLTAVSTGARPNWEGAGRIRPYWATLELGESLDPLTALPAVGKPSRGAGGVRAHHSAGRRAGKRAGRVRGGGQRPVGSAHPALLHPFGSRPLGPAHPYVTGPDVIVLKARLGRHDRFDCGRPDPEFDLETERALKDFQRTYGLPVTGRCRHDDFLCLGEAAWYDRALEGFGRRLLAGGACGDDVFILECRLALCGFPTPEPPSGQFDSHTSRALKRYQKAAGISPANGVAGPETFLALAGETPLGGRVLAPGDRGTDVYCLQRLLNQVYGRETCPETGFYDLRTREAVRRLKRAHGMEPTGVVDSRVYWTLGRVLHGEGTSPGRGADPG